MRHTHAHQLLDAGNDMRVVQASLGHRKMQTSERYVRESPEDVLRNMVVPAAWACPGDAVPAERSAKRRCVRDALEARRERNSLLRQAMLAGASS